MTVPVSASQRLARVRSLMVKDGLNALVAFAPADCRYLTGFTGEAASVVVTGDDLAIVSDSRFTVQAGHEVPGTRFLLADDGRDDPAVQFLSEALGGADLTGKVGVEGGRLTVKRWEKLQSRLDEAGLDWEVVDGIVEQARLVKFSDELEAMRAAGRLTASALAYLETIPVVGRSERDVALDLEMFLRSRGSEGVAFTFIVAAGERGAMPHGEASEAVIMPDTLVVFDLGAVVDGYASDITRTFATGPLDGELVAAYELVRAAQELGVAAVKPGVACKDVDKVARDHLTGGGMGEYFVHSLGHGVGLEIHEGPGLSARSQDVLEEGMVVTVEPGVYLPGKAGIRIEDTVVVSTAGAEILTEFPRELRSLR